MPHIVLLGDSTLDNGRYTSGGPDVIAQLRSLLPAGWTATLRAVDGSTSEDIGSQLAALPAGATHLVLSVGGNDAISRSDLLEEPVRSVGQALQAVGALAGEFEQDYRAAVQACLARGLPLAVCTIYHGRFENETLRRQAAAGLAHFNDAILRTAIGLALDVIDLRFICNAPADYANPIEPSSAGGEKIARAIAACVLQADRRGRSRVAIS